MTRRFEFYNPTRVIFGEGSLPEAADAAALLSGRVFVVTGKSSMRSLGFLDELLQALSSKGVETAALVEGVPSNPTVEFIDRTAAALSSDCDGSETVIGIGGGSALDAAKGIAFALRNPGSIWDYIDPGAKKEPGNLPLPVIAVPSTAGTGSETSKNAVFTNPDVPAKCALSGPWLFPRAAVIDPRLAASQPPALAAATAADTFSHLFENFTQNVSDPITDFLNLEGMNLVVRHLPRALSAPGEPAEWEPLALASALGGVVLGVSGAHLGHALEHPLSARTDAPHGEGLAAVLPGVADFIEGALPERAARVSAMLPGEGSLGRKMVSFFRSVGLDASPDKFGLREEDDDLIAADALATMAGAVSKAPVRVDRESLADMLKRARRLWEEDGPSAAP